MRARRCTALLTAVNIAVTISGSNTCQQSLLGTFFCGAYWPTCSRDLSAVTQISPCSCHKHANSCSEGATYLVYINGKHKRISGAMIISRLMFESQPFQVRVSSHSIEIYTHTISSTLDCME
ncbi:hypothetical protein F4604DRAFT_142352 [Suillus subluteus]|nr:hypothetical protein F4604DRAFT_142352 [Suillus subluteus]